MLSQSSLADGHCTPVQGRELSQDASDYTPRSNVPRNTDADKVPAAASASVSASTSSKPTISRPAHDRRFSTGPVSPTTQQSPLRQSVSYTDPDEDPFPSPSSQRKPGAAKMALTGDRKAGMPLEDSHQQARAGAWYMRRSRPVAQRAEDADATPTRMRNSPAASATPTSSGQHRVSSPAAATRFSFLASSMTALKGLTSSPVTVPQDDELINLDIEAALFPSGAPAEGDAFSPAAFKNLHMNAAGVLRRLQAAYQDRTIAFQELKAEQQAHDDEKIEVATRTQHLKMQLEGMAQRAAENQAIMQALMEELNEEKKLRMEERHARERSFISSNISTVSEDLGAEEDQRRRDRRRSDETSKSDLSSDTDEESSEEASVFSRSRSPTFTASISDAGAMETLPPPPQRAKPTTLVPPRAARQSQSQMSAFQKLFKGISREDDPRGTYSCRNCQGQDASVAWDTAGLLRDENRGLKQRVGELEAAIEEALDAVVGFGLQDTIGSRKSGT
ncbi:hypothetical protein TOPH_03111 [Tolypocladium ophioglossoides CBS 100239]|uniref:Uncharacterized protein n=1 Tax=Tolypocladium ophioglossoides (strain CBS 100239) TaxID=1163406 RepID=A0A0L0NDS0_TOLOC|nr:hypothetical protein TOPH_03111 [Tolypocladium ophioglossoides CBS 100239]